MYFTIIHTVYTSMYFVCICIWLEFQSDSISNRKRNLLGSSNMKTSVIVKIKNKIKLC